MDVCGRRAVASQWTVTAGRAETVNQIHERRAVASRERVVNVRDRRAERAENVIDIHERRAAASR